LYIVYVVKKIETKFEQMSQQYQLLEQNQTIKMETRQQVRDSLMYEKGALYEVNIDFDGASEAWKANKKSTANGCYKYVCGHTSLKTGKKCMRELKDTCDKCHYHRKK
jgi:hypothetical protein